MTRLLTFADLIDGLTRLSGKLAAFLLLLLVLLVGGNTLGRYALGQGSIALQELEWHLLLPVALIGISVLMLEKGHVRVDMVYDRLGPKTQHALDLFSMSVGVLVACLFIKYSYGYVDSAWKIGEGSPDPGGLPMRYLLKALMPACFALMALQCLANGIRHLAVLTGHTPATPEATS